MFQILVDRLSGISRTACVHTNMIDEMRDAETKAFEHTAAVAAESAQGVLF